MAGLDVLWGSTLLSFEYDATERVAALAARLVNNGVESTVTLRLVGVSEVLVTRPDDQSWDYTEITEAHTTATTDGLVVELLFWTEPNGLTARCSAFVVEE